MQAAVQHTVTVNPVPDVAGRVGHACFRLTKAEIDARFVDVEHSRRSVLSMVERFYNRAQA